ncbi:RNA polymerase factor sigma-54 [Pseudidiomarina taiwanensis]|uniref:RNA polymerase sigma-54 factor n=1 Tax=Pseudidiomarina taiwanensis TaxID=337250 RepID=A0A432ZKS3_9GAMM|nr:RNA polymerase factor sigma-54 [Pseudidiomarina taiwanensis]RUO78568.1 RNA polymerase factor sigma-54 [Pseudidiomarina taiwanensis]
MKQGLQLKFNQQLTMTPQLQQAIKLLQLSTTELTQEIHTALEQNPLLEIVDDHADGETEQQPSELEQDDYSASSTPSSRTVSDDFEPTEGAAHESLQDYLLWQLELSHFSPVDRYIAHAIIDSIDDNGYLQTSLEDIYASLDERLQEQVEAADVAVVLKRIQHFDPIGVGCRSVSECLHLQLTQVPDETPFKSLAMAIVQADIQLLGQRDYRSLMRKYKLSEGQLAAVLELIQQQHPHPGQKFSPNAEDYIEPDVLVRKKGQRWGVELNTQNMPKLQVNALYASLSASGEDLNYIRQQTQEAKWFIRSLEARHDTLLKVASAIVQRQQGFFEFGEQAMKPMVLADIAAAVDMHESTISRVTSQKYMLSPRGMFELKYFFSSQLNTDDGGEASAIAIKAMLKQLVAAENPKKPLSDSKLTELMAAQGIQVARRTIAKYREALNIPPSSQRKRLS